MFVLNSDDPSPLYRQLYNQMREHILSGRLASGARLPSVRTMAIELSVSRNTIDGAYQELYAEGYLYSKPRSGYFVAALHQETVPPSLFKKLIYRDRFPAPPANFSYDFHPASLDPESFPTALWRRCFTESLRHNSRQLVQYGDPQGDWNLRSSIKSYLERSRGVLCETDQIVVCSGLQHSLSIVARLLKENHSIVAVEDPGYHLPRSVFCDHSYTINPVPVRAEGVDLDLLKAGDSTVIYVTPSHQMPLGQVMPVATRLALIEWADSGDRFIIEDDYDSELRYQGKPIPSLQGLRPNGNIIYTGTFSKILSPALRLSYMVLPTSLLAAYHRLNRHYFPAVSLLEQRTMANFMEQGHWERHIRRLRMVYKKKHDTTLKSIEHHFGQQAIVVGQGAGLHVVLHLPGSTLGEMELIAQAQQKGILLFPYSSFIVSSQPEVPTLLLGFGGLTGREIERGVALLSEVCLK